MAVTYVGASNLGAVAANPPAVVITLPALQENDIIVVMVMSKNIVLPNNEINTPSGYTEKSTRVTIDSGTAADDMRTALFWKRALPGDSGAGITISRDGTSTLGLYGVATVWRGCVKSGDPFDTTAVSTNGDITADNDIDFAGFDPTATDVHVVYDGWHADDLTTAADFTNDGTTFTIRSDLETGTGSDATHCTWSADRNGNALAAISPSIGGTAGSSIGYVFGLLPGGGGTTSDDVLIRFGSLDATTGTGLVTANFTASAGAAAVFGAYYLSYYRSMVLEEDT